MLLYSVENPLRQGGVGVAVVNKECLLGMVRELKSRHDVEVVEDLEDR